MGRSLGASQAFLSGRAEPAPPRDGRRRRMALRGQTRRWRERRFSRRDAVSASALVRPDASRGIPFPPGHEARGRWPTGHMPRSSQAFLAGVRSPPLREMAKRRREGLTGANPEMTRKAVFSEGRTLCVRVARPRECRGIPFAADGLTMSRWPRGHMPRSSPCLPYPGVRSPPLRETAKRKVGCLAWKARR
jgi:hypothetical protein